MTDSKELIERLRKLAEQQAAPPDQSYHDGRLLTKEDHVYWLAADALEAKDKEIKSLRQELSVFRARKEEARRDINRAMDKYLKDDES